MINLQDELLPCPFCGGKAKINKGDTTLIGCENQWCHGYVYDAPLAVNYIEAIKAWNTRPPLCLYCNKAINKYTKSIRCHSCANKMRWKKLEV